jgi:hypothetical protein
MSLVDEGKKDDLPLMVGWVISDMLSGVCD